VIARENPVAPALIPVQKASCEPLGMCSSRWRKSGRKGKAKENPRIRGELGEPEGGQIAPPDHRRG